jgi:hypothetical protein
MAPMLFEHIFEYKGASGASARKCMCHRDWGPDGLV